MRYENFQEWILRILEDNRTTALLTLTTQLNVDAERLADRYPQCNYGARRHFAFVAPNSTGAFLFTYDGMLTSRFGKELISRFIGRGLEEYIRTKNSWEHSTFDSVNCTAHGKAVKSCEHKRVHLTTYLHKALPTDTRQILWTAETEKVLRVAQATRQLTIYSDT